MLNSSIISDIEERLKELHLNDNKQLEVIFNDASKLIVEAPAGYGKTKTMISKIAYMLATNQLKNPKKILALTFSVNAAYKIKKDVAQQLPELLRTENYSPIAVGERVTVSNYHGFCRSILKKYGYILHTSLSNIDSMKSIDDSDIEGLVKLDVGLDHYKASEIVKVSDAIKNINGSYIGKNLDRYKQLICTYLLPNNLIPYNAIILLTIILFDQNKEIAEFYKKLYSVLIVDEFQDTNILSWVLLIRIIDDCTKVILMGDSLQRIYGFIGAIPDLIDEAQEKYSMEKITLERNYRFRNNEQMLFLDKNIRLNAESPSSPNIENQASVPFALFADQEDESTWVAEKIRSIIQISPDSKIAILAKQRSNNLSGIMSALNEESISYFNGLFKDDDVQYIDFHKECSYQFSEFIVNQNYRLTNINLDRFNNLIVNIYRLNDSDIIHSLLDLLSIFLKRINKEYSFLNTDEKINFIKDTLDNRSLKQNMEYLQNSVIVTTIHGAKGLEWDYVIIPDVERYGFPNSKGLCGTCNNNYRTIRGNDCFIKYDKSIDKQFMEGLSVFYVAVTRAKKQVYFSASRKRLDFNNNERDTTTSCLINLPGINRITEDE